MDKLSFKESIKSYKKELMGLAIILIICFHSDLGDYLTELMPLRYIKDLCDIGVEIFLLLSGFSLAMSFTKDGNLRRFYKKRILRLLPPYFIVFGLWYAFMNIKNGGGISEYFWNLFFLNYYIDNDILIWFIPVILLYYLILPFYVKLLKFNFSFRWLPLAIVFLDVVLKASQIDPRLTLFRLPIFLIGANLYLVDFHEKKKCNLESIPVLIIASAIALPLCYYFMYMVEGQFGYKYIAYIPISLLIVRLYRHNVSVAKILGWLGLITLELYLLHERVQWMVSAVQVKFFPLVSLWIVCGISICIAIPMAFYLNKTISRLLGK